MTSAANGVSSRQASSARKNTTRRQCAADNSGGEEVLESQLAKTEIVAPFDGVVGLRYISQGGYITRTFSVATMQDIDP